MRPTLTKAVQAALQRVPCSDAALAAAAGIPQSTVSRIRTGRREPTPEVARALAAALALWGRDCTHAAATIRRTLRGT